MALFCHYHRQRRPTLPEKKKKDKTLDKTMHCVYGTAQHSSVAYTTESKMELPGISQSKIWMYVHGCAEPVSCYKQRPWSPGRTAFTYTTALILVNFLVSCLTLSICGFKYWCVSPPWLHPEVQFSEFSTGMKQVFFHEATTNRDHDFVKNWWRSQR